MSADTRAFHLSASQAAYLAKVDILPAEERQRFVPGRSATLSLTKEIRDEILEQLGTRLQQFGFDSEWSPTNEGQMIESIIDVLTVRESGN